MDVRCKGKAVSSLPYDSSRYHDAPSITARTESIPADAPDLSLDTLQHMATCPILHAMDWDIQAELKEPPDASHALEVLASARLGFIRIASSAEQTAFMQQLLKARKQQKHQPADHPASSRWQVKPATGPPPIST